jgi:hypothetical protein
MPYSINSTSSWRHRLISKKVYICCFINTHKFEPRARNCQYVEEVDGKWNLARERTHWIRLDLPILQLSHTEWVIQNLRAMQRLSGDTMRVFVIRDTYLQASRPKRSIDSQNLSRTGNVVVDFVDSWRFNSAKCFGSYYRSFGFR